MHFENHTPIFLIKTRVILRFLVYFLARDSAEASAEASVNFAEASGSAELHLSRFGRSLTNFF